MLSTATYECRHFFSQFTLFITAANQQHLKTNNGCLRITLVVLTKMLGQPTGSPVAVPDILIMLGPPLLHIFSRANIVSTVGAGTQHYV